MSRLTVALSSAFIAALVAGTGQLGSAAPALGAELQIAQARATPGISPEGQRSRFEASMGGFYSDPGVRRYVIGIGEKLTSQIDFSDEYGAEIVNFEYYVLDSSVVGAYVLAPGRIYVTRGLLAAASNEAEVAAPIAHELAHVTLGHARRSIPQEISRDRDALISYNLGLEEQADRLSLDYLVRAGYDPWAQASMLRKVAADFEVLSRLSDLQRRRNSVRAETQRAIIDRLGLVEAALRESAFSQPAVVSGDRHMEIVNGMVFGDLPNVGIVRGHTFYHSGLRLAFEAPSGFSIATGRASLFAAGPEGASMDIERRELRGDPPASMADYLRKFGARGIELSQVEELTINGKRAATGIGRMDSRLGGTFAIRMAAIQIEPSVMLSVRYVIPIVSAEAMNDDIRRSLASIRALSVEEAQRIEPLHVAVVSVAPGETLESLAARMSVGDLRLERFLALNGMGIASTVTPGTRVKLVVE